MSEEDKKVDPNLEEVVDKTTETNEDTDKTDKNEMTLFYQKKAAQEKTAKVEEDNVVLQAEIDRLNKANANNAKVDTGSDKGFALKDKLEAIEFTIAHKDLSPDAIKAAISIAKAEGISNDEALKNPMVEAYISKLKEDESTKNAIPTGNRSAVSTDEEKTESEGLLNRARETGNIDDWAKVVAKRRINK
jgi:hypothetical protein